MSDLIWADDLRQRVRSAYPHEPDIARALKHNDSTLISLLNEKFGWECSGMPKAVLELLDILEAGEPVDHIITRLRDQAKRAADIEVLRVEAWAEVNNLVEGQPILAHRPYGDFA